MNKKKIALTGIIFLNLLATACGNSRDAAVAAQEIDRSSSGDDAATLDERGTLHYRWDGHGNSDGWAAEVADGISEYGLINAQAPADVAQFCPKYSGLSLEQKKMFWIYLVSSIAELESGFKTTATYKENFNDSSGHKVISRGLLQISLESGNDYGCGIKNGEALFNSQVNLNCGVRILNHWIDKDGRIAGKGGGHWLGAARYWAPFRTKLSKIKGWTKSIPFCH